MLNISEKILKYVKDLLSPKPVVAEEKEENAKSESNAVTSSVSKAELTSTLKNYNEQLKGKKLPSAIQLEKMEYNPLTEEEIESLAKSSVEEKFGVKINDLNKGAEKTRSQLKEQEEILKQGGEAKKKDVAAMYDELTKQAESSALKRGIARSSIVQEQIKSLGVEKIKDVLAVEESVAKELKENSNKLSEYEKEYEDALNALNVSKAAEIKEQILDITEKQNDKINEVLKYNNQVIKDQAALDEKYPNVEPLTQEEETKIKNAMLQEAFKYFGSMSKEKALSELKNDVELKGLLGDLVTILENYYTATK